MNKVDMLDNKYQLNEVPENHQYLFSHSTLFDNERA